jgi:hypothetical protein
MNMIRYHKYWIREKKNFFFILIWDIKIALASLVITTFSKPALAPALCSWLACQASFTSQSMNSSATVIIIFERKVKHTLQDWTGDRTHRVPAVEMLMVRSGESKWPCRFISLELEKKLHCCSTIYKYAALVRADVLQMQLYPHTFFDWNNIQPIYTNCSYVWEINCGGWDDKSI